MPPEPMFWLSQISTCGSPRRKMPLLPPLGIFQSIRRTIKAKDWRKVKKHYFGMGSTIVAFSENVASPGLSAMRYWTFNSLCTPEAGSPPKAVL
jgi:hypothetical protein